MLNENRAEKPKDSKERKMSGTEKPEQTTVNGSGTVVDIDTRLTRDSSRFELIDKDGNAYRTKFASTREAVYAASLLWPDQEQDPDRTGKGWDIQVVR